MSVDCETLKHNSLEVEKNSKFYSVTKLKEAVLVKSQESIVILLTKD